MHFWLNINKISIEYILNDTTCHCGLLYLHYLLSTIFIFGKGFGRLSADPFLKIKYWGEWNEPMK